MADTLCTYIWWTTSMLAFPWHIWTLFSFSITCSLIICLSSLYGSPSLPLTLPLCASLSPHLSLSFSISLSLSLPLSPCLSHSPCLSLRVIVWIRRDCIWPDSRVVGWQWNKWPDNHLLPCSLSTQGYEQKNHYRPETEPSCHVTCDTHAHISGTYSRKE